mmetsp:Transcript_29495/g.42086  ORF Transcript_29495/g.42086 Transcript_29495/m.42086 type:complete len:201 (-) Transcript_29495:190-792(-)
MRRKKVVFVNVDVYKVGIYISEDLDRQINTIALSNLPTKDTCFHFASPLSDSTPESFDPESGISIEEQTDDGKEAKNDVTLSIVLQFVRDVDSEKVVTAMQEALLSELASKSSSYEKAAKLFIDLLRKVTGDEGIKKSDELIFIFHGQEDNVAVSVLKNAKYGGRVDSSELRRSLIEVYVGDSAVAPEVVNILKTRYNTK